MDSNKEPVPDVVSVILESHKRLAQYHSQEIAEVRYRLFNLKIFTDNTNRLVDDIKSTHERFRALIATWEGKQESLSQMIDKNTQKAFAKYLEDQEKQMKVYRTKMEEAESMILQELSEKLNKVITEAESKSRIAMQAMNQMVEKNANNLAHEMESLNKAISRQRDQWGSQVGKLYTRILIFSTIGGMGGVFVGFLFLKHVIF